MSMNVNAEIQMHVATAYEMVDADIYDGQYQFTPTDETQTAGTANKMMLEDIVINPIPNSYGHIAWNGSILTVS